MSAKAANIVSRFKSETLNNAREWADMLVAPQKYLCHAPSSIPYLASKARFVRSVDIAYANTDGGAFTVAMTSNARHSLAITGVPGNVPAALTPINVIPLRVLENRSGDEFLSSPLNSVRNTADETLTTCPFVDGKVLHAAYSGMPILRIQNAGAYTLTVSAANSEAKAINIQVTPVGTAGAYTWSATTGLMGTATFTGNLTCSGFAFRLVDESGNALSDPKGRYKMTFKLSCALGQALGVPGESQYAISTTDLVQAGRVDSQRCTAMSLLITNMAAPIEAGGELVIARAPIDVLSSQNTAVIMDTIKKLPEQRYWRSGPIVDGGYAWWLPDDLASYEPLPYLNALSDENVLVAAGVMSNNQGFIRVQATWTFEFYSPVQLFDREYSLCYSEQHRQVWEMLTRLEAVSANFGHLALISAAASVAMEIFRFYQKNQKTIDPLAAKAVAITRQAYSSYTAPKAKKPGKPGGKAEKPAKSSGVQPGPSGVPQKPARPARK